MGRIGVVLRRCFGKAIGVEGTLGSRVACDEPICCLDLKFCLPVVPLKYVVGGAGVSGAMQPWRCALMLMMFWCNLRMF